MMHGSLNVTQPRCSAGWCIFNDLAVAGKAAQRDAGVGQVLMIDLDVHQGDGSATIFAGARRITLCVAGCMLCCCACCMFCMQYHC